MPGVSLSVSATRWTGKAFDVAREPERFNEDLAESRILLPGPILQRLMVDNTVLLLAGSPWDEGFQ